MLGQEKQGSGMVMRMSSVQIHILLTLAGAFGTHAGHITRTGPRHLRPGTNIRSPIFVSNADIVVSASTLKALIKINALEIMCEIDTVLYKTIYYIISNKGRELVYGLITRHDYKQWQILQK